MVMTNEFWRGKVVLVTGHTGFKGSWLSLWLQQLGAEVTGVSLDPPTSPSLYEQAQVAKGMTSLRADIRDGQALKDIFVQCQPEIVFHLAAQPLVRYSYQAPVETYEINVMGTLHVLEAMRSVGSVRAAVMVTTDKCYDNKEWAWGYREIDHMGGHDPYSSSKGAAELLIASYRDSYFSSETFDSHKTAIASVRAGNVIGGGDWAADRLIPDTIKSFQKREAVVIRYPHAIRPWQHVLEPLSGYLLVAERLCQNGLEAAQAWNFGPVDEDAKSVAWIVKEMAELWGEDATWQADLNSHPHEASFLKLDISKARSLLGWSPRWTLAMTLNSIVEWYKALDSETDMRAIVLNQIEDFTLTQPVNKIRNEL